jgi:predicted nucleic acid-binding protein
MIVVADTSPVNYLILIDQIHVLQALFGQVVIPGAVHAELVAPRTPQPVRLWAQSPPDWLEIRTPSSPLPNFAPKLGRGEVEAIALAEELTAQTLIIDETAGRREAERRGLVVIGTLGILRNAHSAGLLDLHGAVDRLLTTSFRADPALIAILLRKKVEPPFPK